MPFLLADSFQSSLDKLNGEEQKAAKLAAFELQINPANPGLQCHRLDNIKDKNFWSARASRDIRLIFHRVESSLMLCYVDQHDPAYDWASRRKIETHPVTGAAQIVEIRETVREIQIPIHIPAEAAAAPKPKRPLSNLTEADLLSYGVPAEWIPDVRTADDDMLLVIASHLPGEAAEAIIDLATGTTPAKPEVRKPDQGNPYEHPDAQRCFRVLTGTEELVRALDYPWERWIVFLHPSQTDWVSRSFNGPTRVQGSAGTGKTVRINYRTSHQIRSQADQLLDPESRDVDGNVQDRRGAISVFYGPEPDIRECEDSGSESEQVAAWIEQRRSEGRTPRECGIFVRSEAEITRAESALQLAELPYERLRLSAMRLGRRDQLKIVRAARTIALQKPKERGMGRGEISVSSHRGR